ncbi:hypothetical protein [Halostagnicola sp. A-GB9-2]|uniref:hypothetical protein n=1 Tax=Halostagnicola sp. A-GB9-2 TaxID=3048066 RepID=UPI0024BF6F7C|nr:hypothetical protein [Halostagnicola sp. A-GB9-2]MDJ1432734.1 hypothetical protein [Halostagnicola sp. A-GB9-2]
MTNIGQYVPNDLEVTILIWVSTLLLLDYFVGISEILPDGWFHLLLGVYLFVCAAVLFIRNDRSSG